MLRASLSSRPVGRVGGRQNLHLAVPIAMGQRESGKQFGPARTPGAQCCADQHCASHLLEGF